MTTLFHHPLCPFSRKIRLLLGEKKFSVELVEERPWEHRLDFLMINPSGEVPVLVGDGVDQADGTHNIVLAGHYPISEWLEENSDGVGLLPESSLARAEVRRVMSWFDDKFHSEVGRLIVYEKVDRRFMGAHDGGGGPDMETVRAGLHNLKLHLSYMDYLLEHRDWLAGDELTMPDFTAAAHLSCLDYTGDIVWKNWESIRDWYARLKSRPSFRPLLADHLPGLRPPRHYVDLDF